MAVTDRPKLPGCPKLPQMAVANILSEFENRYTYNINLESLLGSTILSLNINNA